MRARALTRLDPRPLPSARLASRYLKGGGDRNAIDHIGQDASAHETTTDHRVRFSGAQPRGLTVFFFLVPFLDVVRRSFLSASGERFAGWDNYAAVLGNEAFLLAAGNTAKFMLACIPVLLALSLALALAVRESTPFRRLAKTAFLVPCAVPVYAAALLAGLAFDARGMVNGVLAAWNVHPVAWLTSDAAFSGCWWPATSGATWATAWSCGWRRFPAFPNMSSRPHASTAHGQRPFCAV